MVDEFSDEGGSPAKWRFRDINWRFVLRSQLWATAAITILPIIALGVVHWVRPALCCLAISGIPAV